MLFYVTLLIFSVFHILPNLRLLDGVPHVKADDKFDAPYKDPHKEPVEMENAFDTESCTIL